MLQMKRTDGALLIYVLLLYGIKLPLELRKSKSLVIFKRNFKKRFTTFIYRLNTCRVGLVVSVSASHTVGREFASRPGHTYDHHTNSTNCPPPLHGTQCARVRGRQCSPTVQRPGSVWNCLWGNALKRSPGIIRKSRVSYPGPRFLSSATWPSLPKKHYNGLNQTKYTRTCHIIFSSVSYSKIYNFYTYSYYS